MESIKRKLLMVKSKPTNRGIDSLLLILKNNDIDLKKLYYLKNTNLKEFFILIEDILKNINFKNNNYVKTDNNISIKFKEYYLLPQDIIDINEKNSTDSDIIEDNLTESYSENEESEEEKDDFYDSGNDDYSE